MISYRFRILVLLFFFVTSGINSQPLRQDSLIQNKPQKASIKELQDDFASILDNPDLAGAFIGISVQSLETGEYIYQLNNTKNFIPASTLKLLTTSAALDYLGKDFRYSTKLYLDGELQQNGEFVGNVIIRGSGDPSMNSYFFKDPTAILDDWATKLELLGIKSISGNIIGDDRYFDEKYYSPGWSWEDLQYPFAAQVGALSICENKIDIQVFPAERAGTTAKISMYPENNYVQIVNNVMTEPIGNLTNIYPQKEVNSNLIYLHGVIAQDTSKKVKPYNVSVTIDNPTRFFLHLFKDALSRRTIRFRGAIFDINDWFEKVSYIDKSPVCEYESPSLFDIVSIVNKHSHNLSAEMLLKTIGKEMSGEGSTEKGISYVKRFASKVGMDPENMSIVDGSGLSRYNLISPDYLVTLLSRNGRMNDSLHYQKTLAIPGKPGTLARRMTKTHAETRTFGKTGTLNNVSNLVAYVVSRDEEVFAVAIMVMNFITPTSIAENLQDLICMRLASFSRKRE